MSVKYKDVKVGAVVKLGRFTSINENKTISNAVATIVSKDSSSSGHYIEVSVEGAQSCRSAGSFLIRLPNIKEIISTPVA